MPKFTRKQYLNNEVSFQEYYGQFVDNNIKMLLKSRIGGNRIKRSTDEYLNDIPFKEWYALEPMIRMHCGKSIALANDGGLSLSDCVCVAKVAAMQIKDEK